MDTSIFFAKFFGIYLIIIGLVIAFRRDFFQKAVANFLENPAIIFWAGIMALIFGLLVLLIHPIFELSWRGIITLFGILAIVKGLLRLFAANKERIWLGNWWKSKKAVYVGYLLILIGLYLSYHGFVIA